LFLIIIKNKPHMNKALKGKQQHKLIKEGK